MNPKNTWLWVALAAGLFAFIFFVERHLKKPETGPPQLLPSLNAAKIDSIQVQPKGQLSIQAVRTNGGWHLIEPLEYPARGAQIEGLLTVLQKLRGAPYLSPQELKTIPDADEQFGFSSPQFSVMLGHRKYHLHIGRKTPPGDQVYVEVVGSEGVFVVDANLLKLIPKTANDWRDTALVNWPALQFNRLVVTNAGKPLELHYTTNELWRMTQPMEMRADRDKVRESLNGLQKLQVQQFVSDDAKPDLESFGLQTPDLSLVFFNGTNLLMELDFGKSPTNDSTLAYARRADQNTIVTVSKAPYETFAFSHSHDFRDFLDPQLVAIPSAPDQIEIRADENFTLQRGTNDTWRVMPGDTLADSNLVSQVLINLTNLQATPSQIVKEIVPAASLPEYGLAPPFRQYILRANPPSAVADLATNLVLAQLEFGTNQDKLFARVPGESFVYSMPTNTLDLLPAARWQMRDRRIWLFNETDVASVTIHQGAKSRQLIRQGDKSWALGQGAQGIMDAIVSAQIEETVHRLGDLTAVFWVQKGAQHREQFGFEETNYRVEVELKSGEKLNVTFGKDAPSHFPYAEVSLNGEPWVFEFPWAMYQFLQTYLTIPANVP